MVQVELDLQALVVVVVLLELLVAVDQVVIVVQAVVVVLQAPVVQVALDRQVLVAPVEQVAHRLYHWVKLILEMVALPIMLYHKV